MKSILVTGAGRGIGLAITERLAASGWQVWAGARSDEQLALLQAIRNVEPLRLDITDRDAVAALATQLPRELYGVVNNAGVVTYGPVEAVPATDLARQLEVNVVAQIAVTQAVLPMLRRNRGRVLFVSSLNGRVSIPGSGAYNASKFALEALADALRVELRQWGVRVSLIEPGTTDTDIWRSAVPTFDAMVDDLDPTQRGLYRRQLDGVRRLLPVLAKTAVSPQRVAAMSEKALLARRPRARYLCDLPSRLQWLAYTLTPTQINDAVFASIVDARSQRFRSVRTP